MVSGTAADLIVATLKAAGVKRIFGVVGDSLNGITDALRRDGTIEWRHMRHEEAAAFAASAEAQMVRIDVATDRVDRVIDLAAVSRPWTFIDDVRFNGSNAYLTDAGAPGLIVLDEKVRRRSSTEYTDYSLRHMP